VQPYYNSTIVPTPAPGVRFGPYELISPVGAGGMGEVWKARDTRVDRIVAIKTSQQQFSERFEREARAIAALNHPNICSLYDVGPDYLVMEYVDGEPIRPVQNLRKQLDLAVQIADGLAAAHAAGITHRDLKPDNVLVTGDGRVKVLDFGLAKRDAGAALTDADATRTAGATEPGMVLGTISYMSPEQARGLPLDTRSDQFSFGVMLYELASGKRPFTRDSSPQTMAAIIEAEPEALPPSVPAPVRWIIERCLAKEPSARYESTRDLYRDLRSVRDHISEVLSSGSAAVVSSAPSIRRWVWSISVAAAALLIGAAGFWIGARERPGAASFTPVPLTSSGGYIRTPSFSPDGSEVVFAWNGPREGPSNLYVKLIGSNDLLRLTANAADEGSPAWSPDGKRIAFVRSLNNGKCAVMITSPLGGSERKLTEISTPYLSPQVSPEEHSLLAWTPDGRYLAVAETAPATGLYLISVDTAERKLLINDSGAFADVDPAFSPEGDRIAYVRMITVFSNRALWMPLGPAYQPAGPATEIPTRTIVNASPLWTGSGQLLLSAGAPGGMRLFRTTPGAGGVPVLATNVVTNGGMALSAKTGRLIYASRELIQNLFQISLSGTGKSSQAPERLTSTSGNDFMPRYSPDGKSVAFSSFRFGDNGIWTIQTQGTLSAELASSPQATLSTGDWSPDGRSLVFFSTMNQGRWQLYRVAIDTGKVTRLTDNSANDIFPTWSRTGEWIYFASTRGGGLQLYKMPSSGGPATLVVPRTVGSAQESADGWLWFADWPDGGLYRMPVGGGNITRVIDHIHNASGYVATTTGVYYWGGNASHPELRYLDLQTRRDELLFQPPLPALTNLTMSPDGRRLCFPLVERNSQELMMIENWR
jgi:eukaryotic-like serine/threonine-protein kinase